MKQQKGKKVSPIMTMLKPKYKLKQRNDSFLRGEAHDYNYYERSSTLS